MSLFAHRRYRPDEKLDPIDAEMLRMGRARLRLQADGSFSLVDNPDLHGSTLAAQLMRARLKLGGRQRGRVAVTREAVAYSLELQAGGMGKMQAREKAAQKYDRSVGGITNAELKFLAEN